MGKLILVRHGTSAYNAQGLWTGWDDPDLAQAGIIEAERAGESLKGFHFDFAYSSALKRATQTLDEILKSTNQADLPIIIDKRLNERNYGIYTKKNKWQVKAEVGEEEFQRIRRGWDHLIPNGESLKQVYDREIPYFINTILPQIKSGKSVIIVSSGNALRAIVKYLENISDNEISNLEFGLGEVYIYEINENGEVTSKEIKSSNENKGKI